MHTYNEVEKRKLRMLASAIKGRNKLVAAYWLGQCDALGIVGATMDNAFCCDAMSLDEAYACYEMIMRWTK